MPVLIQSWSSGLRLNDGLNYGTWVDRVYHPAKSCGTIVPSETNGRGYGNQIIWGRSSVGRAPPLQGGVR